MKSVFACVMDGKHAILIGSMFRSIVFVNVWSILVIIIIHLKSYPIRYNYRKVSCSTTTVCFLGKDPCDNSLAVELFGATFQVYDFISDGYIKELIHLQLISWDLL